MRVFGFTKKLNVAKFNFALALIVIGIQVIGSFSSGQTTTAPVVIKGKLLSDLNEIKSRNLKKIEFVNEHIKLELKKSENIAVGQNQNPLVDKQVEKFSDDLGTLIERKNELMSRQQFYDRLIFLVETEFNGGDLKLFLAKGLMAKAIADGIHPDTSDSNQIKFYAYLAAALREIPEPRENLLFFIESFLNYSSINDPKPPQKFLDVKDYSNGYLTIKTDTTSPENSRSPQSARKASPIKKKKL